ncbi:hypothetical protein FACS1894116_07980 [Betaproteobacteria bacterium]|nr:hypothetical protein AGMMS49543_02320 [Betaproteobacteria bacterium]GHT94254.1 hypothetical protein FACS1894116_07980 [Betaproteobacteria bacterium]GHT99095.1 hypothetical protein AGMMS49960_03520 [Betaproteobacteria bacterium]GHU24003.1 hypothetical protein AGMMS50243_26420 [Betaproteobacteria bacterium]
MVDTSLRLPGAELNNLQSLQQGARTQALEAPREREAREATAPQQAPLPSTQVSISDAGRAAVRAEAVPESNAATANRPVDAATQAGPATPVRAPEQAARPEATRSEPPRPDAATPQGREAVQRYLENAPRPVGQAGPSAVRVAA